MSSRTASIVSASLSLLLLVIFEILAIIFELIALNGATEGQGATALGVSLACLGVGAILLGIVTWKVAALLINRLGLNPILAVLLTVTLGMLIGGAIAILSLFLSISLAGVG